MPEIRSAGSLGDRMAEDLRGRIVRGEVPDGERLVEDVLAEEYDVSRGPVRDALRQLAAEQLVEIRRGKAYARTIGHSEIEDLYALRTALEPVAMTLAARNATAQDWAEAEDLTLQMTRSADERSWTSFAEADLRFHALFYRASRSPRLEAVWNLYQPTFRVMIQLTTAQDDDLHPSAASHTTMLRDLRSGDVDRVLIQLEEHLAGSKNRMLAAIQG
ncbi:GntR family transcriptional regulator [Microbacterium sp. ET2]|uniref:GntR family transcriptional regulator n=1 Tax=Microbacterium albipurpureum TaxID=3050384 RepID=UPI00259CB264|nr:GntR family transcriptional regulator [Microbacterium sp. ET2 (Ac-2212)]WJL96983.1 GntR family transcriptional regulator [Microbacterium sp. ET2 (Ac-2212)]